MKKIVLLVAVLIANGALAKTTSKTTTKASSVIEVSEAKIFAPLKGTNTTAGYGTVKNLTDQEIELKISKVEPFKAVETHETKEKSGHMAMEKVESFKIPAKASFELKPGGNHIMLFDATREVKAGDELTVQFLVDGKPVDTKFKVETRTENSAHGGHH